LIHLPFENRAEAGRLLAKEISVRHTAVPETGGVVVALARGGVPVGFEVADRLQAPLDVIIVRKLGVPWQPELAMGAIAKGTRILDDRTIRYLGVSASEVEETIRREEAEMNRREALYRGGEPPIDLRDRTVILLDDGLATGSTMLAALRAVRDLEPAKVVVAAPVGSKEACRRVKPEADDVVCLATPDRFLAVGEWYREFDQVTDAEVEKLLTASRERLREDPASAEPVHIA